MIIRIIAINNIINNVQLIKKDIPITFHFEKDNSIFFLEKLIKLQKINGVTNNIAIIKLTIVSKAAIYFKSPVRNPEFISL